MGCQHYGNRGGAEWCNDYDMPVSDLKQQPVKPGEEITVEVDDIHESGAGVGRTDDGFIVMVDGLLPPARAVVRIDRVKQNHAKANRVVERLSLEEGEEAPDGEAEEIDDATEATRGERLGSRDNFWGG